MFIYIYIYIYVYICLYIYGISWVFHGYPLVNVNKTLWKDPLCTMGKSTVNGPFSIAISNYQRLTHGIMCVYIYIYVCMWAIGI